LQIFRSSLTAHLINNTKLDIISVTLRINFSEYKFWFSQIYVRKVDIWIDYN